MGQRRAAPAGPDLLFFFFIHHPKHKKQSFAFISSPPLTLSPKILLLLRTDKSPVYALSTPQYINTPQGNELRNETW